VLTIFIAFMFCSQVCVIKTETIDLEVRLHVLPAKEQAIKKQC
jgi:hypothetical protein